ncbi:MAG: DUF6602 domain-containing protein [Acidimicrobiales bacterium]|jgi:hypothetical protein
MGTNYVLGRLRCDSRHVCDLALHEGQVGHAGVKGRFRELLLNNLLVPWLPASMGCGTGVIIDCKQEVIDAKQEDIIVFDSLLAPPILASPQSTHGVYLFDSVLCRIEVKSKLTKADLKSFVEASRKIARLKLTVKPGTVPEVYGALNMLVAYESEIAAGKELSYLCEEMTKLGLDPGGGIVSAMCIADRGFWLLGEDDGHRRWQKLRVSDPGDPLSYFVGVVSHSCFDQRAKRQGVQPLGGGIGLYIDHPFEWVFA